MTKEELQGLISELMREKLVDKTIEKSKYGTLYINPDGSGTHIVKDVKFEFIEDWPFDNGGPIESYDIKVQLETKKGNLRWHEINLA